jgi:hypothetical protein
VKHTHHNSSIETFLTDGNYNIPANAFKYSAAADNEAIGMETFEPTALLRIVDAMSTIAKRRVLELNALVVR